MNKAIFLDRDGTMIYDKNYICIPKYVELMPGVAENLALFEKKGFLLVLVSNQSGVGRGYYSKESLLNVHTKLEDLLQEKKIILDGVYYCIHTPDDNCNCRKPKIGMALLAKRELDIDLVNSYMVGDKPLDIEFGQNFGAKYCFTSINDAVECVFKYSK